MTANQRTAAGLPQQDQEPLLPPALQAPISARQAAPALPLVIQEMSALTCYPNPAEDYLSMEFRLAELLTSATLRVSDSNGRTVYEMDVQGPAGLQVWDTRGLSTGTYLVQLEAGGALIKSVKVQVR